MNTRPLPKRISRRTTIFLVIWFLSIILAVISARIILIKINENREKMITVLKQEFGFPLTFDTIEAHWFGLSLGLSVKKMTVLDPTVPVPFATIENVNIFPDISSLLFKKQLQLKKIVLEDLKLVLGWDNKNNLSVLGLKGELLPTSIDYEAVFGLLSKLQTVVIDSAEIEWRNPHISIKQSFKGEFDWVHTKAIDWKFSGTQQLQIRDDLKTPVSNFNIAVSPGAEEIELKLNSDGLLAQCDLQSSEDKKWQVDCKASTKQFNIAEIQRYYHPNETDLPLLKWLFKALPKGKITEAAFALKGPFDALKSSGEIHFKSTSFDYAEGWPKIEKARGSVIVDSDQITVRLSQGYILDSPIQTATAHILPIHSNEMPMVSIEGTIESTLEKGLLFLQKSPLETSMAEHLEPLKPTGPMNLNLQLEIPLDTRPTKVEGTVQVKAGELHVPDWDLNLIALNGAFQFNNGGLSASNVLAELDMTPISLDLKTVSDLKQKTLELTAQGTFDSHFLQQKFQIPFLQKLQGQALFKIFLKTPLDQKNIITIKDQNNIQKPDLKIEAKKTKEITWSLSSDLKGMKIDLPDFLGKTESELRPTTVTIGPELKGERKITIQMPNRLDAKILIKGEANNLSVKQGQIIFGHGVADWNMKNSLFIGGEINRFAVNKWLPFFDEVKMSEQKNFPPLDIHVLIHQLAIYGLHFDKTWVSTKFSEMPTKWQFEGPSIKGNLFFPTEKTKEIIVELERLKVLTRNIALENKIESQFAQFVKTPVTFYCQDLQYDQGNFGEVSFKLMPAAYGYYIKDLLLETKLSELSGNGEWHLGEQGVYTVLQGKITSLNMGETLVRWDYPTAIRESSGTIEYQFHWPKHPYQFKLGIVDGTAQLKFDKGRILGVNPGLGRIMGLLNIENIRRRLQLDFSDLLKKGFVFDTLKGKFQFKKGIAQTEKLSIDGPSAKITLAGEANMNTKAVNLEMAVTPHMGVGIPVAAAIAVGNPAVGAGLWIIDKLTGSKINKISRHYYQVTGTWDSPSITEAPTKNSGASERQILENQRQLKKK